MQKTGLLLSGLIGLTCTVYEAQAQERGSAGIKGSVFILPKIELRWSAGGALTQDTFVQVTNDNNISVRVRMQFVNGDPATAAIPVGQPGGAERAHPGWSTNDTEIQLTADHPTYWSALTGSPTPVQPWTSLDPGNPPGRPDLDPGSPAGSRYLRGFIVGWAVSSTTGEEINWNHLAANATIVNYQTAQSWSYNAYHFQSVQAGLATGAVTGTPGVLRLDGVEFSAAYDSLLFNFMAAGSTAYSSASSTVTTNSDLTLHPVSADLNFPSTGPVGTRTVFDIYNMNEIHFSIGPQCLVGWDERLFTAYGAGNAFNRSVLQTDAGWARVNGSAGAACPGAAGASVADAALCGVVSRNVLFNASLVNEAAGFDIVGEGVQIATIQYYDIGPFNASSSPGRNAESSTHPTSTLVLKDAAPLEPRPDEASDSLFEPVATRQDISKLGSLFFIPSVEVRYTSSGALAQDTFIHLANTLNAPVDVQMCFVNGDPPLAASGPEPAHPGYNRFFKRIKLTANQATYFSLNTGLPATGSGVAGWTALDPGNPPGRPNLDPGSPAGSRYLRGFIVGWAVDSLGREIRWDHLMADAMVMNYSDGTACGYGAQMFQVVNPTVVDGGLTGTPGILNMDGVEYAMAYDLLLNNFVAVGATGFSSSSMLVISNSVLATQPITVNVVPTNVGSLITKVKFDVWNLNEIRFSNAERCVTAWEQKQLGSWAPSANHFLRANLQTDVGKMRMDGIISTIVCPGSVNVPINALLMNHLTFNSGVRFAVTALSPVGAGTQAATFTAPLIPEPENIVVPPVTVTTLTHSHSFNAGMNQTTTTDAVTFPCSGGACSGPGFTASIGENDTIVIRFQAPANKNFHIYHGPGGTQTFFYNARWTDGTADTGSTFVAIGANFENLVGTAPINTFNQHFVADAGHAFSCIGLYSVVGDCTFTALTLQFLVNHAVPDTSRTYGVVNSSAAPSFGSTRIVNGVASDFQLMRLSPLCPADINGNTAVNVDDLLAVINSWGACPAPCPPRCLADVNPPGTGNCFVNVDDLLAVINAWGLCP